MAARVLERAAARGVGVLSREPPPRAVLLAVRLGTPSRLAVYWVVQQQPPVPAPPRPLYGTQYGDAPSRRAVPLAISLLHVSNPDVLVVDTLSRLSHDQDSEVAHNAILGLGLLGAGEEVWGWAGLGCWEQMHTCMGVHGVPK